MNALRTIKPARLASLRAPIVSLSRLQRSMYGVVVLASHVPSICRLGYITAKIMLGRESFKISWDDLSTLEHESNWRIGLDTGPDRRIRRLPPQPYPVS